MDQLPAVHQARAYAVRARLTIRVIETLDGKPVKDRRNPRAAFEGHTVETPWDDLNLAYFSGYAMWNYLTTPFIFALPGFQAEEIEPWDENGEKRRRLKVMFPDHIATHCAEQIFHINGEGLICRLDYSAPVAGGAPTAHYLVRTQDFDGNQGGDEAAGAAPESRRHRASRSGFRGDRDSRSSASRDAERCRPEEQHDRYRSKASRRDDDRQRRAPRPLRWKRASFWFICCGTISVSPEPMSAATPRNAAPAPSISMDRRSNPARFSLSWPTVRRSRRSKGSRPPVARYIRFRRLSTSTTPCNAASARRA